MNEYESSSNAKKTNTKNKGGGILGDTYSVAVRGKKEKKKKEKIVFLVH